MAEGVSASLLSAERINSLSLLDTRHIVTSIRAVLQLVRVVLLLAIVFAWAQFVLGLFPWTRTASRHLFALLLDPLEAAAVAGFRALPGSCVCRMPRVHCASDPEGPSVRVRRLRQMEI